MVLATVPKYRKLKTNLNRDTKKKKIRKRNLYSKENMELALDYVHSNKGSVRGAEKKFNIPRSSIHFKMRNPDSKYGPGLSPVLMEHEEADIVEFITELLRRGFPRKTEIIKTSVQDYLKNQPRRNRFTDNRPSNNWNFQFLKRHREELALYKDFSNCSTQEDLKLWFKKMEDHIFMDNLSNVISDPGRVFIIDETVFDICAKSGKIYVEGICSSHIEKAKEKITVIFSFASNGAYCNPMIVYPYEKVPDKIADGVPVGWSFGRNKTGRMTAQLLYEYITNVLFTKIKEDEIELPVILFVDGHKTCVTLEVLELCKSLQIHIVAIYHNYKVILPRGDVALLRPIQTAWKKGIKDWYAEKKCEVAANKLTFAPFLNTLIDTYVDMNDMISGFHASGLNPFNYGNISFHSNSFIDADIKTEESLF